MSAAGVEVRCEHHARVPYLVRCELAAGHDGDHAGRTGTRHGWTHRADLPSATPQHVDEAGR